jgi:hypothetical protein
MSEHVNAETLRAFYSCFDNEDYATRVKTFFSPSVGWHVAGEQSSPTPDETTGTPHHRGTAIHTVIPPLTIRPPNPSESAEARETVVGRTSLDDIT